MKKIKYADYAYICQYKESHFMQKYFCNNYISLHNRNEGALRYDMKWWFYILIFIPLNIIDLFYCIWALGLKNFEIEPRNIIEYTCVGSPSEDSSTQFGRLVEVWNKY